MNHLWIMDIQIRAANSEDLSAILKINDLSFGQEEEGLLVKDLLSDNTAEPIVSLIVLEKDHPVGHILFTRVHLNGNPQSPLMHILAPMSVLPGNQGKGIGQKLIQRGFEILTEMGSKAVLVLGHFDYYPKAGFIQDARALGLEAPYPIPEEYKNGWMVKYLHTEIEKPRGKVICADKLMEERYWVE